MKLTSLRARPLAIPFRVSFRHNSAARAETAALLARAETARGAIGLGEGCPRPYVTGEDAASCAAFFATHRAALSGRIGSLEDLRAWSRGNVAAIDANPAAWCALELALLDALAREESRPMERLLGLPPLQGPFAYTAVLGAGDLETARTQIAGYARIGFTDFKLKVTGDAALDGARLREIRNAVADARVRLDANNLWNRPEDVLKYLDALPLRPFALEEPLRAGDYAGLRALAKNTETRIILDESFRNRTQFEDAASLGERAVINLRVSKMGGLLRSLAVAEEAARLGIPLVIGAQVGETSLLTRAALTVASAARENVLAQEGAFGTLLLERDIVETPLMFGSGGRIGRAPVPPGASGFGLEYLPEFRDF